MHSPHLRCIAHSISNLPYSCTYIYIQRRLNLPKQCHYTMFCLFCFFHRRRWRFALFLICTYQFRRMRVFCVLTWMHIAQHAHYTNVHLQSLSYRSFQLHIIHLNLTDSLGKSRTIYIKYTNLSNIQVFEAYDSGMESDVLAVSMNLSWSCCYCSCRLFSWWSKRNGTQEIGNWMGFRLLHRGNFNTNTKWNVVVCCSSAAYR